MQKSVVSAAVLSALMSAAPVANAAPPFADNAKVETVSESFIVQPSPFSQSIALYTLSEVRYISVTVWVDFSGQSGQTCDIRATLPSGGARRVGDRFASTNGSQQQATIDFNADEWGIQCFNNSSVNTDPFNINLHATEIFSE